MTARLLDAIRRPRTHRERLLVRELLRLDERARQDAARAARYSTALIAGAACAVRR